MKMYDIMPSQCIYVPFKARKMCRKKVTQYTSSERACEYAIKRGGEVEKKKDREKERYG